MILTPKFFTLSEFRCKCCKKVKISSLLVLYLDYLRKAWDGPLLINSGYRCLNHNAKVGGSPTSRHLIGCAADIRPQDPNLIIVLKMLVKHTTQGLKDWEVILTYDTFVHIGVPREESSRLWSGDEILLNVC